MTTFTTEDRMSAEKNDGIYSRHNACCYRDECRQQQATIKKLKERIKWLEGIANLKKDCKNG